MPPPLPPSARTPLPMEHGPWTMVYPAIYSVIFCPPFSVVSFLLLSLREPDDHIRPCLSLVPLLRTPYLVPSPRSPPLG